MSINDLIKKLDIFPSKEELKKIKRRSKEIIKIIKKRIQILGIRATVNIGGSFAKGTIVKDDIYDVDIFVRFDKRHKDLSKELERILSIKEFSDKEKVHGSRDYFRIRRENIIFEVIPIKKIKKPEEADNVTDLSYFHVNYVKKKINPSISREIIITKVFLKSLGVYGAESYIAGISGYGVECLIIHYKTFLNFVKAIINSDKKIIIDIEKAYKNNLQIQIEMNENKISGPMILIDPTWKERNVLAALSLESFERMKEGMKRFLKNPNDSFFKNNLYRKKELSIKSNSIKNSQLVVVRIETNKQEGDIAGMKIKKFSKELCREIEKQFFVQKSIFEYEGGKKGTLILQLKPKKEILIKGPPIKMKKHAEKFRKKHRRVFEKKGILYSKERVSDDALSFLKIWIKSNKKKIEDMNIVKIEFTHPKHHF